MTKKNELETLMGKINKKYGDGTIILGSDYPDLVRVPTGVFSLDVEIGGGVPKGRIMILTGNESTSKTTVSMKAIAEFQNRCRNCLSKLNEERKCIMHECEDGGPHNAMFVDIEGTFDPKWFRALGGNLDELYLLQPEYTEQACDVIEAVIRTGDMDIIVVDSIAMMSPAEEIEKSSENMLMGVHARLTNRLMRSISSGLNHLGMANRRKPSIVLINQLREKVGVMFGSPDVMPGGKGQKFAASITIKFFARPSERVNEEATPKRNVGQLIRFNVEKNKTFPPNRSGTFTLFTDYSLEFGREKGEVDNDVQIVKYGLAYGLISKNGSWYSYGDVRRQGESGLIDGLIENELLDQVKKELVEKILGGLR